MDDYAIERIASRWVEHLLKQHPELLEVDPDVVTTMIVHCIHSRFIDLAEGLC